MTNYTALTPGYQPDDAPIWNDIENVAMLNEMGFDPDENTFISHAIYDDDLLIGAAWSFTTSDGAYSAHLAVLPDYQGQGVGRQLIDATLSHFHAKKGNDPDLTLDLYVTNALMMHPLFRRGIHVSEDLREPGAEGCVIMTEAPELTSFFTRACRDDASAFFEAMRLGAQAQGVSLDNWLTLAKQWADAPAQYPTLTAGLEATLPALPLPHLDKAFLWAQLGGDPASRKPYPVPDPKTFHMEEPDHAPDPLPSPPDPNPEFHRPYR